MAASITSDQLKNDVAGILKGADLSTLSSKKVRKQLEKKYGSDLTDRKKEIDSMVMDFIENRPKDNTENGDNSGDSDANDDSVNKNDSDGSQSGAESDFEPPEDGEPRVKKRKMVKKSESDDEEMDDEKLAKKLQEEEEETGGRRTRGGGRPRKPPPKRKPKNTDENGEKKPRKKGTYGQELILSPSLADLMGEAKMVRSDVVKKMWAIIKERNLADPRNGQFMICDEQLQKIFGRKRVKTFGMMKYLSSHMFKPGELEDMIVKS